MIETIQRIIDWNTEFGNEKGVTPDVLQEVEIMWEEYNEYQSSLIVLDKIEVMDAVLDMFVVGVGTLHKLGYNAEQINACMEEIMRANFSKFPVTKKNGKIQKGPNYVAPNLKDILGH